jgi:hypothetical protein
MAILTLTCVLPWRLTTLTLTVPAPEMGSSAALMARASSGPPTAEIAGCEDGGGVFTAGGGVARRAASAAVRINIELRSLSKIIA